ncbi:MULTISPECIES: glutathione S-transferase family protein [Vibrio]|uniref:glutathione transferase n=3 Tax=Vibrio TaxID=662 RepID=A0A2N7NBV4_9VIBR|nr:glutathione S-transferase family protein [Vibrio tasmaniensis]PMP08083.1 glutathione S-transferase [Vibrio tasmaniensis]TKG36709.1 glutathione S-transferase family protein [Vibrio tasmaniensis]TKG38749.1 glutathione S-transferase family protein [Vibrio tasmaniensis]TKG47212.1 glutathione S-transferase family protein [Vibrio tasmaniensis]TKG51815.1 glutathione S-transferase family protein [Vibrio tasmaniensis]
MTKLISFKNCPFVQRVMGSLVMKNVPFEIEYIELNNKPQWFLDISPNGQVPVLITENDTVLFESDAIVEYLDDKYTPIEEVSPEQKALDRAWSYQASKHYMPQCGTMASKDKETFETRLANLQKAFLKAEKKLGDTEFFKGDYISNVDIAWLPLLHRAFVIKERSGFNMLESFPKVQKWQAALIESGLTDKTVPADFIDKFSGFYLTNNYLASLAEAR